VRDSLAILTGRWASTVEAKDAKVRQKIIDAVSAGKIVTFASSGKASTLPKSHAQAVLAADSRGVTLYNPWGSAKTYSWKTIKEDGDCFDIV
jgi:hypothetical protein